MSNGNNLDDIDREVLKYLQEDARITNAELARRARFAEAAA